MSRVGVGSDERAAASCESRAWTIRRGDAGDYAAIRELYETIYGRPRTLDSIRWLYDANPAGACELWVAEDERSGRVIAARPVFPWRVWIRGQEVRTSQLGDAMTVPEFRGRGIFTALVRAAWSALGAQGIPFTFSFSNPGSLSVYKKTPIGSGPRAGTREVLWFQRMVRPLSLEAVLPGAPGLGRIARGMHRLVRAYQQRRLALPSECSVFPVHRFDGEFDELWARARKGYRVTTVRDAAYLNWRFIRLPGGPFRVLGLRVRGALAGYVAFEMDAQGNGWIADLFGLGAPPVIAALLKTALAGILEGGGVKASIWVATANRCYALVRKLGFVARGEASPMAVHVYRDGWEAAAAVKAEGWWAWYGDRDVERLADEPAAGPRTDGTEDGRVARDRGAGNAD